jgi:hypothetical protein
MAFPSIPAQVANNVYASTLQEFSSDVKSQTFDKMPAVAALWKNKGTGTLGNGRHEIRCETGLNDNAGTLRSDADRARFSQQSNHVVGWYDYMAFNYVPVQKSMIRDSQNSGAQQIFSLAQADMRIATKTMRRLISSQSIAGDGSNGTIVGLNGLLPSVGVGTNTLFNISETGNPWWKNVVSTSAGSFVVNGHHGSSDDKLFRQYLNCSDSGADPAELMITSRDFFEFFVRAEGQKIRITKDADFAVIGKGVASGNAGQGLPYYDATMHWDPECPAGTVYSIHSENVRLIEDPNFNFRWIPVSLGDQFLLSGMVLTYRSQSEMNRRNNCGVQTGWTA